MRAFILILFLLPATTFADFSELLVEQGSSHINSNDKVVSKTRNPLKELSISIDPRGEGKSWLAREIYDDLLIEPFVKVRELGRDCQITIGIVWVDLLNMKMRTDSIDSSCREVRSHRSSSFNFSTSNKVGEDRYNAWITLVLNPVSTAP